MKTNEKLEQASKRIDNAIADLAKALTQGRSEALALHLEAMARFHRYSLGNLLLIMCQCPRATQVRGFREWVRLGRSVRKGEKGILIRAPRTVRVESEDGPETVISGFRAVYVFDVSQTVGEDLPEPPRIKGEPGDLTDKLKMFAKSHGIGIEYTDSMPHATLGLACGGLIRLDCGLRAKPAEEFSTLVHELAHEFLHCKGQRETKRVAETEAQAVASVVCHACGIDATRASSDYIQYFSGDATLLYERLDRIRSTASKLLTSLVPDKQIAAA